MASYSIPRLSDEAYKSIVERAKRARSRKLQEIRAMGRIVSEDDELFIPIEDKADFGCALPTEDEIEQRKLEVQSHWSEAERRKRAGCFIVDEASDLLEVSERVVSSTALRRRNFAHLRD